MRDILFLVHRLPWPPDRGDRIRSWHMLQAMTARHRVHLAAFADDDAGVASAEALRPLVASLHVERRGRARLWPIAESLRHRRPLSVTMFGSAAMHRHVAATLAAQPIDTILAFSGQMAQFVPADRGGRRFVMDFVDVDSAKFADYAAAGGAMAPIYRREARLLARFERETAARADLSLFVSAAEAAHFGHGATALENGVDLDRFAPDGDFAPLDAATRGQGPLIVFTGQMDYRPNVAAVARFARDVLPRVRAAIPGARFAIVGRDPVPAVRRLAQCPGVTVTGAVADVRPWLAAADLVVAPLAIARGIQNKVLEAMAMARPVVASPAAFAGIDALPGRDLIVAEGAEPVVTLLGDPLAAKAMGVAARDRVTARYAWSATLAPLDAMLGGPWTPADMAA